MGTSDDLDATLSLLERAASSSEPREVRAGPAAPTHPRFPRDQGLNGAAVASRAVVVVQDVAKDPRYLATLTDTRGEMIMPVTDPDGSVVGTIDVESGSVDAFGPADHVLLEQCASALRPLWILAKGEACQT